MMEPLTIDITREAEIAGFAGPPPKTMPIYMNEYLIGTAHLYVGAEWSYILLGLDGKGFRINSKAKPRLELNTDKTKPIAIVFYYPA